MLDENLGGLPAIMKLSRARPLGRVVSMQEAGVASGSRDENWIDVLGQTLTLDVKDAYELLAAGALIAAAHQIESL